MYRNNLRRHKPFRTEPTQTWLITYGDMITLLLTFFVLLWATTASERTTPQLDMVLSAFRGFGTGSGGVAPSAGDLAELGNSVSSLPAVNAGNPDNSRSKAASLFEEEIMTNKVKLRSDGRGLVVSLPSDVFFASGSGEIRKEESRDILQKLTTLLDLPEMENRKLRFEGHTDNSLPAKPWKSNWDLSGSRAQSTLAFAVELEGGSGTLASRCEAVAEAEFHPIQPQSTPEGQAANRRVDIVIMNPEER